MKNTTRPIGIENQIEDVLFGISDEQAQQVAKKIQFARENCHNIVAINGAKVFDVTVDNESKLRYNLKYWGIKESQMYYYPVQYASIEYKPKSI